MYTSLTSLREFGAFSGRKTGFLLAVLLAFWAGSGRAQDLIISEFMASNDTVLLDEDEEASDWIEVHNPGTSAVTLTGWGLTDDATRAFKWVFPTVTLDPGAFLVVFASNKDRRNPAGELHTNFKLSAGGEFLALVKPGGTASGPTYAPYPSQDTDQSYGIRWLQSDPIDLVTALADAKAFVPGDDSLGTTWHAPTGFDDSTWTAGQTGVGYDLDPDYLGLISLNVEADMYGKHPCAYIRIPFQVDAASAANINEFLLNMRYDDGFVAFINGVEIAQTNAPAIPAWNTGAGASHSDSAAVVDEPFTYLSAAGLLVDGANLLAIHALNNGVNSTDLLQLPTLQGFQRGPDPSHAERFFSTPTPGVVNGDGFLQCKDTKFSMDRGWYTNSFTLAITSETPGTEIRYTTDFTEPTATYGQVYTSPITVSGSTVIRAAAFKNGYEPTNVDTMTYLFRDGVMAQPDAPAGFPDFWGYYSGYWPDNKVPADYGMDPDIVNDARWTGEWPHALTDLPTLSVVLPNDQLFGASDGIYAHPVSEGVSWERAASAEFIYPDGSEKDEQINCGLRIYGGENRKPYKDPKHSFRLLFKGIYGATKLKHPIFQEDSGTKSFDTLVLRGGYNNMICHGTPSQRVRFQYISDVWAREAQLAMDQTGSHGRYVHLFLNGLYWGLYNISERPSAAFAASYGGGAKEEYDSLNSGVVVDGDKTAWNTMMSLANAGVTTPSAYAAIQEYVDATNLADYMLINFYAGNIDWDDHNWYATRRRAPGAGYKFHCWDSERTLEGVNDNKLSVDRNDKPSRVFQQLRQNAEFRLLVADRATRHCFHDGALSTTAGWDRFEMRANEIDSALALESARWGDYRRDVHSWSSAPYLLYTREDHWYVEKNRLQTSYFPQRSQILINQLKSGGLYPATAPPEFNQHGGTFPPGFALTMTGGGTLYYTLDGSDPREPVTENVLGSTYMGPISLTHAVVVKARVRSTGGEWSALQEALFVPDALPWLQVTEVMCAGVALPGDSEESTPADYEFLEIKNAGSTSVSLVDTRFTSGVDFQFGREPGSPVLLPGDRIILAADPLAFANRYPTVPAAQIVGPYSGALDDQGENLEFVDGLGRRVFAFSYNRGRGWPVAPFGTGHSLVPVDEDSVEEPDLDYGENWRSSTWRLGSPGEADPAPVENVLLNEIAAHTDYTNPSLPEYDSNDWIELFHTGPQSMSLADWYLSDDPDQLKKWAIPGSDSIGAGQWKVYDEVTGFHHPIDSGFGLDKAGERLFLTYWPAGSVGRVADAWTFQGQENGVTTGRYPDGDRADWRLTPTPGTTNAVLTSPVILREVMYHPAPTTSHPENNQRDEYVEIYNGGTASVSLETVAGSWRLSGEISFTFPPAQMLAPGARIWVVPFDPALPAELADFRAVYGLSAGDPLILGPFGGELSNRGGRLSLEKPQASDDPTFPDKVSWVVMDELIYHDREPWYTGADATGRPLQRLFPECNGHDPRSWTAATDYSVDDDGDGLPDRWEQEMFDGRGPWLTDPNSDDDGDRARTVDEFIAGTHPGLASDYLHLMAEFLSGHIQLTFNTRVPGAELLHLSRWYRLEEQPLAVPLDGWEAIPGYEHLPGNGSPVVCPDADNGTSSSRFRVRAWLEP